MPGPDVSFLAEMSAIEQRAAASLAQERTTGMSSSGTLFDLKRFALHDGPGVRTTVFLKGCPLSCSWCHNPESQDPNPELMFWADRCVGCGACVAACPNGAISISRGASRTDRTRCTACGACVDVCPFGARAIAGEAWSLDRLVREIEKDLLFYDESGGGVTLSGGEPLAQASFSISLLSECRKRRIHTAVDTCGHAEWEVLRDAARWADLILYDVKHPSADRHRELTGVANERILENLRRLDGEGCPLWIRVPVVPGLNDASEDIAALGGIVADLDAVEAVHLLPYHPGGEAKRERLGRPASPRGEIANPADAANRASEILEGIVDVPVRVGG